MSGSLPGGEAAVNVARVVPGQLSNSFREDVERGDVGGAYCCGGEVCSGFGECALLHRLRVIAALPSSAVAALLPTASALRSQRMQGCTEECGDV